MNHQPVNDQWRRRLVAGGVSVWFRGRPLLRTLSLPCASTLFSSVCVSLYHSLPSSSEWTLFHLLTSSQCVSLGASCDVEKGSENPQCRWCTVVAPIDRLCEHVRGNRHQWKLPSAPSTGREQTIINSLTYLVSIVVVVASAESAHSMQKLCNTHMRTE